MPTVNLNIAFENNGVVDKRQYSLNLIDAALNKRFPEGLNEDQRNEYQGIYKKIKAIVGHLTNFDVDLNKSEVDFIRQTFQVTNATLIDTIDIYKLEKKFQ